MSNFRKNLEEKFSRYQSILADRVQERGEKYIDIEAIAQDFCCIDGYSRITIKHIPLSGSAVYYTVEVSEESKETTDIEADLSSVGEKQLAYLVEVMRKAMIIEELRNTYVK